MECQTDTRQYQVVINAHHSCWLVWRVAVAPKVPLKGIKKMVKLNLDKW